MGRDRRKDDQINHMGHFFSVQKGLIYPPTLGPHDQEANLSVAGRQQPLCQGKRKKKKKKQLREMKPDVSYRRSWVCVLTRQGGTNQHLAGCCHMCSLHISPHLAIGRRRSADGVLTPFIGSPKQKKKKKQIRISASLQTDPGAVGLSVFQTYPYLFFSFFARHIKVERQRQR